MSFVEPDRVEAIEARMRTLETELAALKRFPDDQFAPGTLIRFDVEVPRRLARSTVDVAETATFTYAALKVADQWWITGTYLAGEAQVGRGGISYDKLRQVLTRANRGSVRLFAGDGEPLERETSTKYEAVPYDVRNARDDEVIESAAQAVAVVDANLSRMGVTLGGEKSPETHA